MINWIATNVTGSYCLKKSHITLSLLQRVLKMPPTRMQAHKCSDLDATCPQHIQ